MIRKALLASAAAGGLLAGSPASAADLGVRPAAYVAPVPVFTWTGIYVGGNVGGKWGSYSGDVTASPFSPVSPSGSSFTFDAGRDGAFVGGGQLGFNWQAGQWVFGLEGDFEGTDVKRDFVLGFAPSGGVFVPGDTFRFKNDWQASLRARGGIAFDRWLVYATGGVAWADIRAEAIYVPGLVGGVTASSAFETDSKTPVGGTVGGGLEYAVTNNVSVGVEYRYSDFGHETFNAGVVRLAGLGTGPLTTTRVELRTHEVTARLNFKLGTLFAP